MERKRHKVSQFFSLYNQVMENVDVVYVAGFEEVDPELLEEYNSVLQKWSFGESAGSEDNEKKDEASQDVDDQKKKIESDPELLEEQQKEKGLLSNKKRKLQRRMKIAELKQICSKPDLVEIWDATSADPKLLVYLKSYRNTVPVPRHWSQKRKYLQGKRGIEKQQPFQLPDFIAATGIERIRQADSKKLKQKQRERVQPRMGRMDIDYQVLHDAFFKYQTRPKLTSYGELYYEGKEFDEAKLREIKPGTLSRDLKEALGMREGVIAPPPWLINMQRYGPPPSYPHLKIPGGDVFGIQQQDEPNYDDEPVDKTKHWGDLEEEEEEEEEDQMEEEEPEDGIQSVDSLSSSTLTGLETPDVIDLRKQQPERPLYQILEEKEERIAPGTLLGTTHTYVLKRVNLLRGQKADKVDVTLQPEELEAIDHHVLAAKYEEAREEERMLSQHEDFSDMVAENEKKRKRKMQDKEGKSKKSFFKF